MISVIACYDCELVMGHCMIAEYYIIAEYQLLS